MHSVTQMTKCGW